MDFSEVIRGHTLEYFDDTHLYLVDGVKVPSITQMLKTKFGGRYDGISKEVLRKASEKGTEVHEAIEAYCKTGVEADLPEVRGFRFLQKHYGFKVIGNEVPVILCVGEVPIAAGRLDMVIEMDGHRGLADIKRTATLDKEYLAYQLNLYRLAYMQSYGWDIDMLRGIHLRDDVRKFVKIPINTEYTIRFIEHYLRGEKNDDI